MRSTQKLSSGSLTSSQAGDITYLTVSHVRDVVHALVSRELTQREPMPEWETVNLQRLEATLDAPRQGGFGIDYYPELHDKAAILLYLMTKNHAWANGNKRMAFISTLVFLGLNGRWWDAAPDEARTHVVWIAASEARLVDQVLAYLCPYFKARLVESEVLELPLANS